MAGCQWILQLCECTTGADKSSGIFVSLIFQLDCLSEGGGRGLKAIQYIFTGNIIKKLFNAYLLHVGHIFRGCLGILLNTREPWSHISVAFLLVTWVWDEAADLRTSTRALDLSGRFFTEKAEWIDDHLRPVHCTSSCIMKGVLQALEMWKIGLLRWLNSTSMEKKCQWEFSWLWVPFYRTMLCLPPS